MSSKRGRKRNDNLPPNRARDVQRAFRARRAAHLEALEHRVAELEDENNTLRAMLNLPLANRPPLGKGPTGKDKPQMHPTSGVQSPSSSLHHAHSLPHMSPSVSLDSATGSRTDDSPSEASTSTHSLSPETMSAALAQPQPHPSHAMQSESWEESMFIPKEPSDPPPPPVPSATYASTSFAPSGARQVMPDMYMQPVHNYPHTADRPMSTDTYSSSGYPMRDGGRPFPYSQPSFHTHDTQMHGPSPTVPSMSSMHSQSSSMHSQNSSMPYTSHRRSLAEQNQGYRPLSHANQIRLSHYPHASRMPSPPEVVADLSHSAYELERRVNRMY